MTIYARGRRDFHIQLGISEIRPGDLVEYQSDRPFQLVFIDFGMVTEIPSRLQSALREYVIGVGNRDAFRIVQSYVQTGTLLPRADLKRLIRPCLIASGGQMPGR